MDYKKLGFKAGLEIHQQLETNKLFCSCPSMLRDETPDIKFKRKLIAVSGESGKLDVAAKHEMSKQKEFCYQGYSDSNCLVEFDEEPPHGVNQDALEIVLQVAKLLNCKIFDEIQVMRKTVIDGSNTSGFQRTMLVGTKGYLNTSKGNVGIDVVCLEEDSARKVKQTEKSATYKLDRLGIPLIEIGTSPDIKDPEHAKEVAKQLGMILRSTGKVKRGLGTIRQDVNVSIARGTRVEIKGFQDLKTMPKIIDIEVKRQMKGKIKSEVRKANSDGTSDFLRPIPGAARMYPETDIEPIKITKKLLDSLETVELISDIVLKYEKCGLNPELARQIVKEGIKFSDYKYKIDRNFIAHVLVEIPKEIKKRFKIEYEFKKKDFDLVLDAFESSIISKGAVTDILVEIANGKKINLDNYKLVDDSKIESEIKKLVEKNKDLSVGGLMGIVMGKYKGKVDGKKIAQLVNKYKN
ncbi:Glu-tRNA(Gln) amidotransferase subunit GatE [archaeon]|jgi:Glu-tRNA(Gln) amidotransferase subunit E-like FAD-binding protein|nr:Glu-tRNA(Gln) amidotransferase subunit GatE [archaeon]